MDLFDSGPVANSDALPDSRQARRHTARSRAAEESVDDQLAPGDLSFVHSIMCQVGLPRARVVGREFMRKSGSVWLYVQAGMIDEGSGPIEQPIPYGPLPRLALAFISSYAKKNNTREIDLGHSAADFLALLGMDDQGNRYGTLRKQMHALAACRLQLGYAGRTFSGQPVEQFDAWLLTKGQRTGQKSLWPGTLVLSETYFQELVTHGVPLDTRHIQQLSQSALKLDIYTWLAHRLHRLKGPTKIHWLSLREQFGQEYVGHDPDRDFKKAFAPALDEVLRVYQRANVKKVFGGLQLLPSAPPVPYKEG